MRIVLMIPMILLLLTIVFVIVRVLPGDPVMLHFEKKATEAQLAALRHILGMDVPIIQQYFNYLVGFFRGDLGLSMGTLNEPIAQQVFSAFPATLELALYAIVIAALIGVFLGAKSAESYNSPKDHLIRVSGIVSYAIPVFFLGMIFQMVLCVGLGLFPVGGRIDPGQDPVGMNLVLSEPAGGFIPGFVLPSLVALLPLALCLILFKQSQKPPKPRELEMIFVVFFVSTLLYSFGTALMPGMLMAPVVSIIPLVASILYLKPGHFTVQSREWRIALEVFAASWILYTLAGGLFPILLLSYLVGLLPALIFLKLLKKRKMEPERRDFIITFAVLIVGWMLLVLVAAHFTSLGSLRVTTGLFTVDSVLEGSVYKFVESFRYLFLPALTLGIVLSGVFIRLTRTNMIETLRLDFVTAARARGLRKRTVIYGYALRNAFLPVLTMIGLQFAALLGGAVLTETTFSWPGLGRYFVDRINLRDYTAIQGAVVVFGVLVMLVSLVVDLLYAYLDPRIRL
jgi:peptide/nickel transport system permease protein